MRAWAGVDVGLHSCDAVALSPAGQVLLASRYTMDGTGPTDLIRDLARVGRRRRDLLPVAIEDATSPLAATLASARFPVINVHGLALARFRQGQQPSRTKSDRSDALALANFIRLHPGQRPRPSESPELLALRAVVRGHQAQRRTLREAEHHLWSHLHRYYGAALPVLRLRTQRDVYIALELAPDPGAALRLRPTRLARELKARGRNRRNLIWSAEIIDMLRQPHPRMPRATEVGHGVVLLEQIALLQHLTTSVDRLRDAALRQAPEHALWPVVASFPGLTQIVGATLLGEIGDDPARFSSARGLLALAGVAPVTRQSGGAVIVHRRRIHSGPLARAVRDWTLPLLQHAPPARELYDHRRSLGDRHGAASRIMLSKYLRALHACLLTSAPYDEQRLSARPQPGA